MQHHSFIKHCITHHLNIYLCRQLSISIFFPHSALRLKHPPPTRKTCYFKRSWKIYHKSNYILKSWCFNFFWDVQKRSVFSKKREKRQDLLIINKRKTGITLQHTLRILLFTWFKMYLNGRLQSGLKPSLLSQDDMVSIPRFNSSINI